MATRKSNTGGSTAAPKADVTVTFAEGTCRSGSGQPTNKGRLYAQGGDAKLHSLLAKALREGATTVQFNDEPVVTISAEYATHRWAMPTPKAPKAEAESKQSKQDESKAEQAAEPGRWGRRKPGRPLPRALKREHPDRKEPSMADKETKLWYASIYKYGSSPDDGPEAAVAAEQVLARWPGSEPTGDEWGLDWCLALSYDDFANLVLGGEDSVVDNMVVDIQLP